jgi:hypothetical protein
MVNKFSGEAIRQCPFASSSNLSNSSWATQLCSGFLFSAVCLSICLSVYLSVSLSSLYPSISHLCLSLFISLSFYLTKRNSLLLRGRIIFCWTLTFIFGENQLCLSQVKFVDYFKRMITQIKILTIGP